MDFNETGVVKAICISPARGTEKHTIPEGHFIPDFGIEGDAHAGTWHRQVSLLSYSKVEEFSIKGAKYNLDKYTLEIGDSRTVSNEFITDEIRLELSNGTILVVYSKD